MGGLSSRKGSLHFHIQSMGPGENGTLEITFDPKFQGKIELKLATNRQGNYGNILREKLITFIQQTND